MPVITSLTPMTELEAVNECLSAIGEQPVTALAAPYPTYVEMAINILRSVARELQTSAWKFNFEPGLELAPSTTTSWVDTDGVTSTLNVFTEPVGVLAWKLTQCSQNVGLDLVKRPPKTVALQAGYPTILYDRVKNRDGALASQYPYVYVDALWAFDFDKLPETARKLITVRSARRLAEEALGSADLSGMKGLAELQAFRLLKQDQSPSRKANMFHSASAREFAGQRDLPFGGHSFVVYPGKA